MYKHKRNKIGSRCLECGDHIVYGRIDKKFCCDQCKNKYNYKRHQSEKAVRTRVFSCLGRNYTILNKLLAMEVHSIDISDVIQMGFNPDFITSFRKISKHEEYRCFDIRYLRMPTRLVSIEKTITDDSPMPK